MEGAQGLEGVDYQEVFWGLLAYWISIFKIRDLLVAFEDGVRAAVGSGDKCERISVLRAESCFRRAVINVSVSEGTFARSVANEMNIILLFEIYNKTPMIS